MRRAGTHLSTLQKNTRTSPYHALPCIFHPLPMPALPRLLCASVLPTFVLLAGCTPPPAPKIERSPQEVRAELQRLIPARVQDRAGWAADIQSAFQALRLPPTTANLCAVLAVIEQESSYNVDPVIANLGAVSIAEIKRRAARLHIPALAVDAALRIKADDGEAWGEKLAKVKTERELSALYTRMLQSLPALLRGRLEAANPVRTGGPMQVSIRYASLKNYPYQPVPASAREAVFSRQGGLYFGIAHLLKYPNSYPRHIYRFADFNAGHYASRNAAFQHAVSQASGIPLALDGDLIIHGSQDIGATENAIRTLAHALDMSDKAIRADLELGSQHRFESSTLYQRLYALAEARSGKKLPRQMIPRIRLESPKITRQLTTEWFANRVESRYRDCEKRAAGH